MWNFIGWYWTTVCTIAADEIFLFSCDGTTKVKLLDCYSAWIIDSVNLILHKIILDKVFSIAIFQIFWLRVMWPEMRSETKVLNCYSAFNIKFLDLGFHSMIMDRRLHVCTISSFSISCDPELRLKIKNALHIDLHILYEKWTRHGRHFYSGLLLNISCPNFRDFGI